jgi:hypothetical protein
MSNQKRETKLIKFVKRGLRIIKRARTPFRNSKFSNHIYNNHVHLMFLALRALSGMSYERFIEWIENFDGLLIVLRIKQFPHFTTLQKFSERFPRRYLDILIVVSSKGPEIRALVAGIDSTGFSLTNASYYYTSVIQRNQEKNRRGKPRTKRRIKRFLKATFIAETRAQKILAVKIRRGPANDCKDFIPAFKKLSKLDERRIKIATGDRGFDSEQNHRYIRDTLGGFSIIPARKYKATDYRIRGKYRREMMAGFSQKDYHQRCKMETINSVIKRKMGSSIRSRRCRCQNFEMVVRAFAYNIEKGIPCVFIGGFLESP